MIEYDQRVLPLAQLLSLLEATEKALPSVRTLPICPKNPLQHAIRPSLTDLLFYNSLGWGCSPLALLQLC